jgi:hypothetical protein
VDTLVGENDVLKDGEEAVLAVEPAGQFGDRVQADERIERPAVVTGRKVGGAHHPEREGGQHGLSCDAATHADRAVDRRTITVML